MDFYTPNARRVCWNVIWPIVKKGELVLYPGTDHAVALYSKFPNTFRQQGKEDALYNNRTELLQEQPKLDLRCLEQYC